MVAFLLTVLPTLNRILVAGIAITAFSLLLFCLNFNLRDRVARAFAVILACVTLIAVSSVLASTSSTLAEAEMWLRLQWVGTAILPSAYLHFSDALLASTGRPSRGRRRLAVRAMYLASTVLIYLATLTDLIVARVQVTADEAHLVAGQAFWIVPVFFTGLLTITGVNLVRAYRRCQTSTSRRRMLYLISGSAAPALASFPFLVFVGEAASVHPLIFWLVAISSNSLVATLLVVMAYATAYFGVSLTDRVIKARLFQWLLRGPIVAATTLAVMVIFGALARAVGMPNTRAVPLAVVATIVMLQFLITLLRVPLERRLFYGSHADRADLRRLETLEERVLTRSDLRQFLETLLAGLCDLLRVPAAFIVERSPEGSTSFEAGVGPQEILPLRADLSSIPPPHLQAAGPDAESIFRWGQYWLLPLHAPESGEVIGLLGMASHEDRLDLGPEALESLMRLSQRAAQALQDRRLQQEVFASVDRLVPEVDRIQRLSAAARYGQAQLLASPGEGLPPDADLAQWVRDALSHYWGGPKLTQSPLLNLRVVQRELEAHDGNPVNALRSVLRRAIERVRPEGERRFTSEWLLYNILEMKFVQGRRVRDIAGHLAVSEADLYRKQRVALDEVTRVIIEMERRSHDRATDYDVVG